MNVKFQVLVLTIYLPPTYTIKLIAVNYLPSLKYKLTL